MSEGKFLDRVESLLKRYPAVRYERSPDSIDVPPTAPDGFHVSISSTKDSAIVHYDGWHEHFDDLEHALKCFMSGLTDRVRLKVFHRGTYEHKWTAEVREEGRWESAGTVGLMIFPFWRRQESRVLQNRHVVPPAEREGARSHLGT